MKSIIALPVNGANRAVWTVVVRLATADFIAVTFHAADESFSAAVRGATGNRFVAVAVGTAVEPVETVIVRLASDILVTVAVRAAVFIGIAVAIPTAPLLVANVIPTAVPTGTALHVLVTIRLIVAGRTIAGVVPGDRITVVIRSAVLIRIAVVVVVAISVTTCNDHRNQHRHHHRNCVLHDTLQKVSYTFKMKCSNYFNVSYLNKKVNGNN